MRESKIGNNKNSHSHRALNKIGAELDFASSEAYNYLRINISFSLPDKVGCKLIGVTSSSPAEGKSFTSVNLAYSLAKAGNKVLLIDGDLRKPSLGRMLNKKHVKGLSHYLAGTDHKVIQPGILTENLSVIFSGDTPPNPSELIGSAKMHAALNNLAKRYDYILVDLPPVNAVSDPLVVSKWLDGIIVVTRHKYTRTNDIMNSVRSLKYAGAHILGLVYNGYNSAEKAYKNHGGYYYYNSSYSYSTNTDEAETNNWDDLISPVAVEDDTN